MNIFALNPQAILTENIQNHINTSGSPLNIATTATAAALEPGTQLETSYLLTFGVLQAYSADDITRKKQKGSNQKI